MRMRVRRSLVTSNAARPTIGMTTEKLNAQETKPVETLSQSRSITSVQRQRANIQLVSLGLCLFLVGWNDGTTGPLLPRIQSFYRVLSVHVM